MMNDLIAYKKNITSQWGEDGILEEIFNRIGEGNKTCIEFGAWDGKHLSNVWNLWHEKKWYALLIESDETRHKDLQKTIHGFNNVISHCGYVRPTGTSSLDSIITECGINQEIDLISIDIDGDDYHVLKSLEKHLPKIILIEYNPTIPVKYRIIQKVGQYFGSSAQSIVDLASEKGYELVTITETNCIFIKKELFSSLQISHQMLSEIFPATHLTYIISSYDGLNFADKLPRYGIASQFCYTKTKYLRNLPELEFANRLIPVVLSQGNLLIERISSRLFRTLKNILKKTVLKKFVLQIKSWIRNYKNAQIHRLKERVVINFQRKYEYSTFIETGTYQGDMVEAVKKHFKKVVSIELGLDLHNKAQNRFKNDHNVTIVQGDSGVIIEKILNDLDKPSIFWLDAHYSRGYTVKGDEETPILKELKNILDHNIKEHIILIDDARCFNGEHDYPTLEKLKEFVERKSRYNVKIENDIIHVYP